MATDSGIRIPIAAKYDVAGDDLFLTAYPLVLFEHFFYPL